MVFVFESREKIEADRHIEKDLTELYSYTQRTQDIFTEPDITLRLGEMFENYTKFSEFYAWGNLAGSVWDAFRDAFFNAAMHGNQNKPGSIVTVEVEYGVLGSSIFVKDQGKGFDYKSVIERFRRGEPYATSHGGGMNKFHSTDLHVAYHDNGSLISISTPPMTFAEVLETGRQLSHSFPQFQG